jgi:glucose 1-dehydrogenase
MPAALSPRLAGKFALITGGSRGIGRAVAERFAAEGAIVAIDHFRDDVAAEATLAAIREADGEAGFGLRGHIAIDADVGREAEVERMVAEAIGAFGRLDILVNNAGIQTETPGDSFDSAKLEKIIAVNLLGAAWASRAAIRHYLSRPGGGTVINTTSVHEIIPKPGFEAYAMSKAGLGHLTRTLALEFASRGIRVNAVGPGAVTTDLNASWIHDATATAGVESHIPMGFAASSEMIAPVFVFLASDDARYITGQTIFACGGLTLYGDFAKNWAS